VGLIKDAQGHFGWLLDMVSHDGVAEHTKAWDFKFHHVAVL
jgi:hypothetical protein